MATCGGSPYIDAALKARTSACRSPALIGGRSSQSTRCTGAPTDANGHSFIALSAIERCATSPVVS
jgi:hypothetical protein